MRGNGSFRLGVAAEGAGGAPLDGGSDEARRAEVPAFAISQRDQDGTAVVSVGGELDLATAPQLRWTLTDLLAAGVRRLVIDLSAVTFIDSTALGVLVGINRGLEGQGRMAISGAGPEVRNILELTGLDATFDLHPSLDAALARVRESTAAAG